MKDTELDILATEYPWFFHVNDHKENDHSSGSALDTMKTRDGMLPFRTGRSRITYTYKTNGVPCATSCEKASGYICMAII